MLYGIVSALVILLVLMPLYFMGKYRWGKVYELVFKGASTLICVGLALGFNIGTGFSDTFAVLMLIGLVLCLLGDIWLELIFPVGGGLFFLGHTMYIAGILTQAQVTWWSLLFGAVALVPITLVYLRYRKQMPDGLDKLTPIYGAVLVALLALALPLPITLGTQRAWLLAAGAVLFVASDLTLCRNLLEKRGVKSQYPSIGMYYMAQLLLALSVLSPLSPLA